MCIAWAAATVACASTVATSREAPVNESAMDPPAKRKPEPMKPGPGARVQLNPNELVLPEAPPNASDAVTEFTAAASHAVRQVYQADNDDPSVLLSLQESVRSNMELKALQATWLDILQTALARTETLQAVGPALRPLREAMRAATLEPTSQTIQGIDTSTCQNAFTSPVGRNPAIDNIMATFSGVGTFTLGEVREACNKANEIALQKTRLPGRPAPQRISRLVRKLYADAHLGGEVRKVALVIPWHRDRVRKAMSMRAAVGIVESGDNQGCTMTRVSVTRSLRGKAAPTLSEVGTREPILCSQLR